MCEDQEFDIRLTASGEVDTAYYIEQAEMMRAEAVAGIFTMLKKTIVELLSFSVSTRTPRAFSH
jgi:hypothetical protein